MKNSRVHRLHVVMLALLFLWALVCLAAPAVSESAIYIAIAWGPLISYCIAAWLISTIRREVPRV